MDEFAAEARKISNILNFWDFGYFMGALRKHTQESSHKRIQLVLQDYFREKDAAVLLNTLQAEAQMITDIFPECSSEEVITLLEEIGAEENRVRIAVKKILKKNNNMLPKRTFSDDLAEDETARKKAKISTGDVTNKRSASAENGDTNSMPIIETTGGTPLADSQATVTYSFDSNDYETAEVNEVTAADRDILLSIIESKLDDNEISEEPSSSGVDRHSDVTSTNCLIPRTASLSALNQTPTSNSLIQIQGHEGSYVSKVVDDDPVVFKIAKVSSTKDLPAQDGMVPMVDLSSITEQVFATSTTNVPTTSVIIANPFDDSNKCNNGAVVRNLFNIAGVTPSTSVASTSKATSEKAGNDEFHLYKHLMEMFTNVSRKDVKLICKRYGTNKHFKPSDEIISAIVSDLLELTSSSKGNSSDDSENYLQVRKDIFPSDVVNSTTVVPQEKPTKQIQTKQLQPVPQLLGTTTVADRRNFQDHPINLISRMATSTNQTPIFTVTQNNVITSNTVNVFRNGHLQRQKNVTHVDPPVNDVLDEILTDLMETRSDPGDEDPIELDREMEHVVEDNRLISHLMEMFPEACPQYIRRICQGKKNAPGVLDDLISQILENDDYPRRKKAQSPTQQMDPEEQLEMLKQILPDADPSYLQINCDRFIDKPDEMKVFIANAVETRSYPKLKDYLRKQQISAQQKQYTTEFSVENFLEVIPDPVAYFEDPKRKPSSGDIVSQHYAICFLRNHFSKIPLRTIRDVFKSNNLCFLPTFRALTQHSTLRYMKSKRAEFRMPDLIQNIPLLQEIAYAKHRTEIEEYKQLQKVKELEERTAAKAAGLLQTCSCCFDDEVMPKDLYRCEVGCIFCKECVQRGAEVAFGDGKLDFACLNNCSSHFSLQTLQAVLKPKMFSKVAIKKQLEEVKAAGIEDLEMCPFCDFATIPAKDDKLFRCLNPECMKESCRLCKEPSHVPLRCEEVEKEDDVKMRTYIENKMTEALLRTCYKCNKKFIKSEGCNKMTCSCGALMCYVCGQPVKDYKHFNGPGGDQFNLCPLYSDTNHMHEEAVLKGAEEAKKEIGLHSHSSKLKIDPTADVHNHYQEIAKKNPPPQVYPYVNPFAGHEQNRDQNQGIPRGQGAYLLLGRERLQPRVRHAHQYIQHMRDHHHHHHHH